LLTREEFERRWEAEPGLKRAELIEGRVYLDVTVSPDHAALHSLANTWLGLYWRGRADLELLDNVTVRFPGENDLQPDIALRWRDPARTRSVRSDRAIEGPPELVLEVSVSSASRDLTLKKDVYQRNGVAEYLVWQLDEGRADWYVLQDGAYVALQPDEHGIIESRAFPGLRLDVPKLLAGDVQGVLAALG
jgi:Uma2 family endonuclease